MIISLALHYQLILPNFMHCCFLYFNIIPMIMLRFSMVWLPLYHWPALTLYPRSSCVLHFDRLYYCPHSSWCFSIHTSEERSADDQLYSICLRPLIRQLPVLPDWKMFRSSRSLWWQSMWRSGSLDRALLPRQRIIWKVSKIAENNAGSPAHKNCGRRCFFSSAAASFHSVLLSICSAFPDQ